MHRDTHILTPLFGVVLAVLPWGVSAQASNFVFVTDSQTIAPSTVSGSITMSAGAAVTQTTCLLLSSSSGTGQFSSSASNWNPVSAVTMSKNTSNRTFYYQDATNGSHTLSVRIAPKPDSVSASCASWTDAQAAVQSTVTQAITIGSSSQQQNTTTTQTDTTVTASSTTSTTQSANNSPVSSYVPPPQPQIFAYAGKDREVIAGADVPFEALAYDRKGNLLDSATVRFLWIFGDGASADGPSVKHHFAVPGRYAVVLDIAHALSAASHQVVVTARPVSIGVLVRDGGIALRNTSGRDLDLSDWFLRTSTGTFRLPPHTILLSGAEVVFVQKVTHLVLSSADDAALLYPNGTLAASVGVPSAPAPAIEPPASTETIPAISSSVQPVSRNTTRNDIESEATQENSSEVQTGSTTSQVASAAFSGISMPWWVGALGLSFFGATAVWAVRRRTEGGWRIIEELPNTGYSEPHE